MSQIRFNYLFCSPRPKLPPPTKSIIVGWSPPNYPPGSCWASGSDGEGQNLHPQGFKSWIRFNYLNIWEAHVCTFTLISTSQIRFNNLNFLKTFILELNLTPHMWSCMIMIVIGARSKIIVCTWGHMCNFYNNAVGALGACAYSISGPY